MAYTSLNGRSWQQQLFFWRDAAGYTALADISAPSPSTTEAAAEAPARVGVLFEYALVAPGRNGARKQADSGISFGELSVILPPPSPLPPLPPLPPKLLAPKEEDSELDEELRTEL